MIEQPTCIEIGVLWIHAECLQHGLAEWDALLATILRSLSLGHRCKVENLDGKL